MLPSAEGHPEDPVAVQRPLDCSYPVVVRF